MTTTILFASLVVLILCFAMTNGFLDGGGIVSTVIMTRVMEPLPALCLVAASEVLGVFLLGRAVVRTLGQHMFSFPIGASSQEILVLLLAAMIGTLAWNSAMWYYSLPSSSSHALLGGLLGATWQHFGWGAVSMPVLVKILIGLAVVPLVALLAGYIVSKAIYWIGSYLSPAASRFLRALHILALAGIALVHGSNDGQKSMALVVIAMAAMGGAAIHAALPSWMGLASGIALGIGVIVGSRRTIKTVGKGLYRVQDLQGLCAEGTTMALVGASSLAGFPMSTSHVMSSSVIGAGAAVRPRAIRWDLAGSMALAWVLTIPATGALAASIAYVVSKAF